MSGRAVHSCPRRQADLCPGAKLGGGGAGPNLSFLYFYALEFFLPTDQKRQKLAKCDIGAAKLQELSEWFIPVSQPSVNATCNDLVL